MADVILSVKNLKKYFEPHQGFAESIIGGGQKKKIKAVDDVSFDIKRGEIFGLIGDDGEVGYETSRTNFRPNNFQRRRCDEPRQRKAQRLPSKSSDDLSGPLRFDESALQNQGCAGGASHHP